MRDKNQELIVMPDNRLEAALRAMEDARRPGESGNVETRSALTSAGVEIKDVTM